MTLSLGFPDLESICSKTSSYDIEIFKYQKVVLVNTSLKRLNHNRYSVYKGDSILLNGLDFLLHH